MSGPVRELEGDFSVGRAAKRIREEMDQPVEYVNHTSGHWADEATPGSFRFLWWCLGVVALFALVVVWALI